VGIKFFGQFLIERDEIDPVQLREALDLMDRENRSLGELAVEQGMMSDQDGSKVNAEQRHCDRPFGELAVELGILTEEQLDSLVHTQANTRLLIGQALTRMGALPKSRVEELLREFQDDQAAYQSDVSVLPEPLAQNPLAPLVVGLLPKLLMRVARIVGKVGLGKPARTAPSFEHQLAVVVTGSPGLRISLIGDHEFALRLAAATSGLDAASIDTDMVDDGVCEFLNVLAGNAVSLLEREGIVMQLEPPSSGVDVEGGHIFELAVSCGSAGLALESL
jgi:CheY-specific phosphatase CheX